MNARTSIFSLLLLTTATGAFAQSQPAAADPLPSRPLNLSVRKPSATPASAVLILPDQAASVSDAASVSNEDASVPASLPYGAGFENRQQGTAGSGNSSGSGNSGSSGGSGNSGGGGRGGSGRGR
jgi:hypothetical protein